MKGIKAGTNAPDKKRFSGLRLLGLGFWQAWWMISMCTDALLPSEGSAFESTNTTLLLLVFTTLGYLVVVLLSKRLSPFSSHTYNYLVAGGFTALGSLALPLSAGLVDTAIGFPLFIASAVIVSYGNALLLIMWGELWSALATGRVGRHLYFSYSFAFVLFFIGYFLPAPLDSIFAAVLPVVSAFVLHQCKDEPRRGAAVVPLDKKSIPYRSIFVCIFAISVLYGFSQGVIGSFGGSIDSGVFIAEGLFVAGIGIAAITLNMVLAPVEIESVALYRPVIPSIISGFIALLVLPEPYGFIGAGLIIMGVYCLDMLIMLSSTDIAYRARIPVAFSFGIAILVTRAGTLTGSFASSALKSSDVWSTATRDTALLLGVLVLVYIGMIFFTQSDMKRFYQVPSVKDPDQASLQDRCNHIVEMGGLTAREGEVLILLARGKTVKGVCQELNIAEGTAKHHVSSIYRKLGVYDRQGLHSVVEQGAVGKGSLD